MKRKNKTEYYLNVAKSVSERSTCLRRRYGAIIVKDDEIIATGYNGSPRGMENCCERGSCKRDELNVNHGERYELCKSVHAEQNCLISAARRDCIGATMYICCTTQRDRIIPGTDCCNLCKRMLLNSGIDKVIIADSMVAYREILTKDWLKEDL